MEKKVEVAIMGAGTAGLSALSEVKKKAKSFVLIDPGPLGTTCARVGCMPSKVLLQIAADFHRRKKFDKVGIRGSENLRIDQRAAFQYLRSLRDHFVSGVLKEVQSYKENYLSEHAEFLEPQLLKAGSHRIRADKIIIAVGSRPILPPEWKKFSGKILTSDDLFEQEEITGPLAVIGMGIIGAELGQALGRLGIQVTGFGANEAVGALTDPEVQKVAIEILSQDMSLSLHGRATLDLKNEKLEVKNEKIQMQAEKVLAAIGRKSNLDQIGIEKLNLKMDKFGNPEFDPSTMQIKDTSIFIAGDTDGHREILHEAADDGRIAGFNSVQEKHCFKRRTRLAVAFTSPNIALVGQSFKELENRNIAIGEARFENQGRSVVKQENAGILRVYGDAETGHLLGAEMIVPDGEHLAHLLAWSIQQNLTVIEILRMPFYHPVVEEGLRTALRSLLRKMKIPKPANEIAMCESALLGLD